MIVARPRRGVRYGVVRFIEVFERDSPAERGRVIKCNTELGDALLEWGYIMYKTPGWAVERYHDNFDPGFVRLLGEVKKLLDPKQIMNPGRWSV